MCSATFQLESWKVVSGGSVHYVASLERLQYVDAKMAAGRSVFPVNAVNYNKHRKSPTLLPTSIPGLALEGA